jgi:hypothetical protein
MVLGLGSFHITITLFHPEAIVEQMNNVPSLLSGTEQWKPWQQFRLGGEL